MSSHAHRTLVHAPGCRAARARGLRSPSKLLVALAALAPALAGCNEATLSVLPLDNVQVDVPTAGQAGTAEAGTAPMGGSDSGGAGGVPTAGGGTSTGGAAPLLGAVGHWPLEFDATDPIGMNDGALQGGAEFVTDPVRGQVLACNGSDAAVLLENRTSLDFSYALWLWTDTPSREGGSALAGDALLYSNTVGEIDDFTFALLNNKLSYISYGKSATGTRSLVDGVWHHVVVTRRDGEKVALYVDGQLDGDGNASSGPVADNPILHVCTNSAEGRFFQGRLDDLMQFDRVLEAREVRALYVETRLP